MAGVPSQSTLIIGFTILVGIVLIYLIKEGLNLKKYVTIKSSTTPPNHYEIKKLPTVFILFLTLISQMFSKKKKSATLSPIKYELNDQIINKQHVKDYCKVCDFKYPNNDENFDVPLTYPQLLGFRVQLLLFLDKLFPFPAMGLVHMSNSVKQYSKITTGMKVNVVVRCDDKLIIHPKGYCFDVICEIFSTSTTSPTLLWSSVSTYLSRKSHKSDVVVNYESVMKENDTTNLPDILEPWKLKGDLGRRYAKVSEDYNPIHITAISAYFFGFTKGCIAHGLWTSSKTIGVLSSTIPSLLSTDNLTQSSQCIEYYVEYKTPIFLPNTVILTGKQESLTEMSSQRFIVQVVSAKDKTKPHMKGYLTRKTLK